MSHYSANPHYAPDDFSEDCERLERCEAEAGQWFAKLTTTQTAEYNARMSVAFAYRGAPKWDRERNDAKRVFEASTTDARRIYQLALTDLMRDGEISQDTYFEIDQALVEQIVSAPIMQAAE